MASPMAAYGRNDLRNIRRDSLLVSVALGPFIYAMAMWLLPPLTRYLERDHAFDLVPYHGLILSAFVVIGPVAVLGSVCGLLLMDDKDQRTLSALRVTPAPPMSYPLYRAVTTTVVTALSLLAAMALTRQVPGDVIAASVPIMVLCGVNATMLGMAFAALARNKVEGLAIMRAVGMLLFGLPIIPYFFDTPYMLLFGLLPTYWPVKAFWVVWDGGNPWPYLLAGTVYALVLTWWFVRRLAGQKA